MVEYPRAIAMVMAMGMATKSVMMLIGVTDAYMRYQGVVTIDRLTDGRACLGIRAGEMMNLTRFEIE